MLKVKKHWINYAKKKQVGEKDINEKFKVIRILREKFNLIGLTGEVISIPGKLYHRMPDVYIPEKRAVIELDGEIHQGWDIISETNHDRKRKEDYDKTNVKLIIINKTLTNEYSESKIVETLLNNGLIKEC